MSIKHIRRIVAIAFLTFLISPVIIILIANISSYFLKYWQSQYEDILNYWKTQPHVMIATIRYRAIAWVLGIVGAIIISKVTPVIFRRLERVNDRYLLMGGMFALFIFGLLLLSSGQHTTLYCERIEDTCNLSRTGIWWSKTEQFSLKKLQGAYIQVDRSDDGTTERVALLTAQGDIPMTYLSYSPGWQSETAKQINYFVMQPTQKYLQVYENDRWISLIVGIIITIISSWILVKYIFTGV